MTANPARADVSAPAAAAVDEAALLAAARAAVRALDARDFAALASLVDERAGLSFAPYLCDVTADGRIAQSRVAGLLEEKRRRPADDEMRWGALYLVFTPTDAGRRLVAVLHDQWTI